ncbi:DMT family transporter [Pararhodobacter sp. CCB-MM2]|uniref:DMT family transporter n=1 Tax=Pararhodobacter sp. CCB-MM2 TaxID=1786003 RepID=UPI001111AFFA|nr:DMT family transporter [Pararhodobacter sp. CCB-MM2]
MTALSETPQVAPGPQLTPAPGPNRVSAALLAVLGYAILIGFTDNYVRIIAEEGGLWQFHATRTAMAVVLFALAAKPMGLRLQPVNWKPFLARSAVHASAMLVYFGCLAYLTVAQTAAGLFTAPIFVLLFSRFLFGHPLGPVRIAAVAVGFVGVVMVLEPGSQSPLGWASLFPVAAGAVYALGNLATREWCAEESAATLTLGFFVALGIAGLIGMGVLALWQPEVPAGTDGFILRGWVWPSGAFLWWTFVQALGSAIAVGLMVRAYQLADASRVSIFEYVILPVSAGWSWLLWGESVSLPAVVGMSLIVAAGAMIVLRNR